MSRNNATIRSSERLAARAAPPDVFRATLRFIGASAVLEKFLGWDRDADLARPRFDEMRQRIDAAIDVCRKDRDNREEAKQAGHSVALALIPLVPADRSEYDHVRLGLASRPTGRALYMPAAERGFCAGIRRRLRA